jgi:hypothetical protein
MREIPRLKVEQQLAAARRALHRAVELAEVEHEFGLEEDLGAVNVELARIMDDVMRNRLRKSQLALPGT